MKSYLSKISGIIFLFLIVFLANLFINITFKSAQIDLTEDKLFTLSEGTLKIISSLDKPIRLRLFYSETATRGYPDLQFLGQRIKDLLNEYVKKANGKLILEVYDPIPDSEAAEWTEKYHLKPIPLDDYNILFLGLVGVNHIGREDEIGLFNLANEELYEYEISQLIDGLRKDQKTKIGLLSPLAVEKLNVLAQISDDTTTPQADWFFGDLLSDVYNVQHIPITTDNISSDISLLIVMHPKKLPTETLYAIDQFVMRGGRLIVLIDPYCQSDDSIPIDKKNPLPYFFADRDSYLNEILEKWGVTMLRKKVVGDTNLATLMIEKEESTTKVKFPLWLSLGKNNFLQDNVALSTIDNLVFAWAGSLVVNKTEGINYTNLITTTKQSTTFPESEYKLTGGDFNDLMRIYVPDNEEKVLAVKLSGSFKSTQNPPADKPNPNHLDQSKGEPVVLVISDVDFLANKFAVKLTQIAENINYSFINENISFFLNLVDNLSGSSELISLRSRGKVSRPFTKFMEFQNDARKVLQLEEEKFLKTLKETEAKIAQLQNGEADIDILDKNIIEEINKLKEQRKEERKNLRIIRRKLKSDVQQLSSTIILFNTLFVPLLIILLAIVLALKNRRSTNASR